MTENGVTLTGYYLLYPHFFIMPSFSMCCWVQPSLRSSTLSYFVSIKKNLKLYAGSTRSWVRTSLMVVSVFHGTLRKLSSVHCTHIDPPTRPPACPPDAPLLLPCGLLLLSSCFFMFLVYIYFQGFFKVCATISSIAWIYLFHGTHHGLNVKDFFFHQFRYSLDRLSRII